jgi:hypothetical protein
LSIDSGRASAAVSESRSLTAIKQINGSRDQSDLCTQKRSIRMKTLGAILAVALMASFIASAPSMAREPGNHKHRANTKRVPVNGQHPIYRYGHITGAP